MLNDHERNKAFYDALALNINENTIVLDIGAGGGLLSMIAAKLGAKNVFAVESNDILAQYLRLVIQQNNLSNKITVINKISHELILGIDIPERVDLIVTETFDCGLIGEGCLNNISHGKENFLKPNGIVFIT